MTIWFVGARPTVTDWPGTKRNTSLHFDPSRMTKYASCDTNDPPRKQLSLIGLQKNGVHERQLSSSAGKTISSK